MSDTDIITSFEKHDITKPVEITIMTRSMGRVNLGGGRKKQQNKLKVMVVGGGGGGIRWLP